MAELKDFIKKFIKIVFFILVFIPLLIYFSFCNQDPTWSQAPGLKIPLGIGVWNEDEVEFFNQYARADDIITARPPLVDLLNKAAVGNKNLVFGKREDLTEMISLAKTKGIEVIAYNLEANLTKEELINKQKEAYDLAKENNLLFVFAPLLRQLVHYYEDFAQHADVIGFQTQTYQTLEDHEYEEVVEDMIGKIKSANPSVRVWVQVSVHPPISPTEHIDLSAEEVVNHINLIADKADGILIFYDPFSFPARGSVVREVFKKLRTDLCTEPADVNCDSQINVADILLVLRSWFSPSPDPARVDVNGDGKVNGMDFGWVLKEMF